MGNFEVWSDGSSGGDSESAGGWGVIVVDRESNASAEYSGGEMPATSNSMELTGILEGLKLVTPQSNVTVYTDSECAVKWLDGRFKRKHPKVIELCAQIEWVIEQMGLKVNMIHVRGHFGIEHNERCHHLANEARKRAMK